MHVRNFRIWFCTVVSIAATMGHGVADDRALKSLPVTRADLATAYMRLDRALCEHPPIGPKIAEVNVAFDSLTGDFFSLRFGSAIEKIHRLLSHVEGGAPPTPEKRLLTALKGHVEPRVLSASTDRTKAVLHIDSLYPIAELAGRSIKLSIRGNCREWRQAIMDESVTRTVGANGKLRLDVPIENLKAPLPGEWDIQVSIEGGGQNMIERMYVLDRPIAEIRVENERRLAALEKAGSKLVSAIKTCQARNRLLVVQPSENNSAEFLANPIVLAKEVSEEIAALTAGRSPYAGRVGDYWRVIVVKNTEIPTRIFAPKKVASAKTSNELLPIVIALHGAGGDENMFMDAYGGGIIKTLAEKHGFIAVSPQTAFFTFGPGIVDGVIDALAEEYPVDRKRVYVLGHSMGAGATAGIARRCAKTVAACCCLAGGGNFVADGPMAPTLVIPAELDALIPFGRLEPAIKKAIVAKRPVEYKPAIGYGHTLMVGAFLPEAIEWLLKRSLGR